MSQDDWPWKHISIPYDLLTSTGVLDVRFLQPDFYIYNLLSVIIWRVLTYLITYKTQRSSQCQICSIVNCFLFWYFNDCSVKILPSSSSPIEKTFAMFLYLLPTRSVLLTCLLRTITKQNMNYMYKFCPNMYLISVKRHFHSIWTHQTFNAFQQYWFWILKIIYYQTDKCISCYMYNHFHILWELNKIRPVLWSYLSYLLDGDIKGLTFLVFGVHSLYNLLAFASSQLTCFWQ